jgi:hypothetical protein
MSRPGTDCTTIPWSTHSYSGDAGSSARFVATPMAELFRPNEEAE